MYCVRLGNVKRQDCVYSDIFSTDVARQAHIANFYADLLDARELILDKEATLSAMNADPLH